MQAQSSKTPGWWTDSHNQGWDRVKEAFRRDWEQTKADFSKTKGKELNQQVGDTVKQAAGKEVIPPGNTPNPKVNSSDDDFAKHEPAYRYGYGARDQYGSDAKEWNEDIESKLEGEWTDLGHDEPWDSARLHVRKGWDHPHKS